MTLPSLSFLVRAFLEVCRRFPLAMICATFGMVTVMFDIEYEGPKTVDPVWIVLQLGLPVQIGLVALAESFNWTLLRKILLQAGGLALLGTYFFFLNPDAPAWEQIHWPRFFGLLTAAHLFVAVAPYLNRLSVADFWEYNKRLFANFIVGAVYSLILFAGLGLAIMAVIELFNLDITRKIYAHLFVFLAALFNTLFFLYHFPAGYQFEAQEKAYNAVFKNLCQYILIPIVASYFLILYAYSIKILVTWTLPRGWVSSLVLGFSVAGIFTYLINYLLPDYTDSKLVHGYRRWFWWVLLPMVGLLFVAIGHRIADYGVTGERFFVAHAGVWLLVMCGYFLWSKTDNIKFIPVSLALFVLVAVLGPFNAFRVSERSQTTILRRLLEKNGRLEAGKLKTNQATLRGTDADRIYSCLEYLDRHDALGTVKNWFPNPLPPVPDSLSGIYYHHTQQIADSLNIIPGSATPPEARVISVYPAYRPLMTGDIAGFRTFSKLELFGPAPVKKTPRRVELSAAGTGLLLYDPSGKTPVDSFDLTPALKQWATAGARADNVELTAGEEVLNLTGKKAKGRLFLQNLRFNAGSLKIESLEGLLFLK